MAQERRHGASVVRVHSARFASYFGLSFSCRTPISPFYNGRIYSVPLNDRWMSVGFCFCWFNFDFFLHGITVESFP